MLQLTGTGLCTASLAIQTSVKHDTTRTVAGVCIKLACPARTRFMVSWMDTLPTCCVPRVEHESNGGEADRKQGIFPQSSRSPHEHSVLEEYASDVNSGPMPQVMTATVTLVARISLTSNVFLHACIIWSRSHCPAAARLAARRDLLCDPKLHSAVRHHHSRAITPQAGRASPAAALVRASQTRTAAGPAGSTAHWSYLSTSGVLSKVALPPWVSPCHDSRQLK